MKICNVWPNYTCPKTTFWENVSWKGLRCAKPWKFTHFGHVHCACTKILVAKKNPRKHTKPIKTTAKTHTILSFQHTQNVSYRLRYPNLWKYAMFGQTTHAQNTASWENVSWKGLRCAKPWKFTHLGRKKAQENIKAHQNHSQNPHNSKLSAYPKCKLP